MDKYRNIGIGLLTTAGFAVYLASMHLLGLTQHVELRVLNFVILLGGVAYAIHKTKVDENVDFNYFTGFRAGMITSIVGVVTFAFLVLIYLEVINPELMIVVKEEQPFGAYMNVPTICAVMCVEGIASGFLATYMVMQYQKVSSGRLNT